MRFACTFFEYMSHMLDICYVHLSLNVRDSYDIRVFEFMIAMIYI